MKLVLLPGLDGTGRLFESIREALRDHSTVVVSYDACRPASYDELVDYVAARLPRGEPFVIVAESFSGPVALELGSRAVEGLAALVLVATFSRPPIAAPRWMVSLVASRLFWFSPPLFLLRVLMVGWSAPQLLAVAVRSAVREVSPSVLALRVREVLSVNVDRAAMTCSVPVLYLQGTADRLVPRKCASHLASLIPGMRLQRVEGPHLLLQVSPQPCASAISEFVARANPHLRR